MINNNRILLKLTALTPVSHGEAGSNNVGANNTTLFNRQLQRLPKEVVGATIEEASLAIENLISIYQISENSLPFLNSLSGSELIAVLFVAQVPLMYGGEGVGLFEGQERYRYLTTRLTDGCITSSTLPELWHYLSVKLGLPMFPTQYFNRMGAFFMMPKSIQGQAINAIAKKTELVVMGARLVAEDYKKTNPEYAKKAEAELFKAAAYKPTSEQLTDLVSDKQEAITAGIPALSGNSLRHCMIREPGATRLLQELGLVPNGEEVTDTTIPIGVERFLYGGGQLAAKAKAPSSVDFLESQVRKLYPLVDALGGSFDAFLLSSSQVKLTPWIICKENNFATEAIAGITSGVSIFDLIEETTRTRKGIGGSNGDSGQMIYNFETLAAGLPVLVEILFAPFTRSLTIGAVSLALSDWQNSGGILGGRSGTGFGRFSMEVLQGDYRNESAEYAEYMRSRSDTLKRGLLTGKFGTTAELCRA